MKSNQVKMLTIAAFAMSFFLFVAFMSDATVRVKADGDAETLYKDNKCFACHTATASKFFDTKKSDADLAVIIKDGKKGEKPPFMPAFKDKLTDAQIASLVTYMRSKAPAPAQ